MTLRNDPWSYPVEVGRGNLRNTDGVHKSGRNDDVGTVIEDVWGPGGSYVWMTSAEKLRVKAGGNAADTAAGSGAQSVFISGLDAFGNIQEETLTTNGSSAGPQSVNDYIRINWSFVLNTGIRGGRNIGNIAIENVSSGNTQSYIPAGAGRCLCTQYTVPLNHIGYLCRFSAQIFSNKDATVRLMRRLNALETTPPFTCPRTVWWLAATSGHEQVEFPVKCQRQPALTDLWVEAASVQGAAVITAQYDMIVDGPPGATP